MKKIILSILLFVTISFLSWCSNNDDWFKKKQECNKYHDNIVKTIWETNYVQEIFYSKKRNSCMYIYIKTIENEKVLMDYLSKEEIKWSRSHPTQNDESNFYIESNKEFDNIVKELKWE